MKSIFLQVDLLTNFIYFVLNNSLQECILFFMYIIKFLMINDCLCLI